MAEEYQALLVRLEEHLARIARALEQQVEIAAKTLERINEIK